MPSALRNQHTPLVRSWPSCPYIKASSWSGLLRAALTRLPFISKECDCSHLLLGRIVIVFLLLLVVVAVTTVGIVVVDVLEVGLRIQENIFGNQHPQLFFGILRSATAQWAWIFMPPTLSCPCNIPLFHFLVISVAGSGLEVAGISSTSKSHATLSKSHEMVKSTRDSRNFQSPGS